MNQIVQDLCVSQIKRVLPFYFPLLGSLPALFFLRGIHPAYPATSRGKRQSQQRRHREWWAKPWSWTGNVGRRPGWNLRIRESMSWQTLCKCKECIWHFVICKCICHSVIWLCCFLEFKKSPLRSEWLNVPWQQQIGFSKLSTEIWLLWLINKHVIACSNSSQWTLSNMNPGLRLVPVSKRKTAEISLFGMCTYMVFPTLLDKWIPNSYPGISVLGE